MFYVRDVNDELVFFKDTSYCYSRAYIIIDKLENFILLVIPHQQQMWRLCHFLIYLEKYDYISRSYNSI